MSNLTLFYAPQPDDENCEASAAYEYARRASDQLLSAGNYDGQVFIHRLSLDSLDNLLVPTDTTVGNDSPTQPETAIILVSCSADGSVDRVVRKLIRHLKQTLQQYSSGQCSSSSASGSSSPTTVVAIALLGHAKCENSANQMSDTIFNHGRKFCKSVSEINASSSATVRKKTIEIQVELEGPDAPGGFDDWLNSTVLRPSRS